MRDTRTPEQKLADRAEKLTKLWAVTNEVCSTLMEAGFRRLQVEMASHTDDVWHMVWIDEDSVNQEMLKTLAEIADAFDSPLSLETIRLNQQEFSRLRIWIKS